jgi:hypothetical protein
MAQRQTAVWLLVAAVLIGVVAFAAALTDGAALRAWEAFLVNLVFWLGVAQGATIVSASFYLTQARWGGAAMYRLAEAFVGFLPVGFLLFWALYPSREVLYPWVDHPIPEIGAWLNAPFFFARDGAGLLLMAALSFWFVRISRRKESVDWAENYGDIQTPPSAILRLAPALVIAYALIYSMLAFDLVMSLAPRWHSTLFGAYFFAGAYWSGLAAMGVVAVFVGSPARHAVVGDRSGILHDLGKMVFAFSVFWVYLFWSQYLVIWYGDIPKETFFVVPRIHRLPWALLGWSAFVLIWVIPFSFLMGRKPKKTPAILGPVCILGLIGMWLERYVLVAPSLSPKAIPFGWTETLITIGFFGIFGLCALPGLRLLPASSVERGGER